MLGVLLRLGGVGLLVRLLVVARVRLELGAAAVKGLNSAAGEGPEQLRWPT